MDNLPPVSVIVPCYNEEKTISLLLDALRRQTYPANLLEVIIADGMSTDQTRTILLEYNQEHPELRLRIVDNPQRNIPTGLNQAIRASQGDVILRLDAHSIPAPSYIEFSIAGLLENKGENIGGVWQIEPGNDSWAARSIALAAGHPFGVGDALYRYATEPGYVDTVPFGCFRRETLEKIGLYDENLLTNEDYELNVRLRQSGGRVYLDPSIRSQYFSRSTYKQLASQYWRYGYWKYQMLRRYPGTLRWRQAVPPLFVAGMIGLVLLGPFWNLARWMFLGVSLLYLLLLLTGSIPYVVKGRDARLLVGIPIAIMVMHFSWGAGFLASLLRITR